MREFAPQVPAGYHPEYRGGQQTDQTPHNPQPICAQIAGNLYLDDIALSVAHKYQVNTDWLKERPKIA